MHEFKTDEDTGCKISNFLLIKLMFSANVISQIPSRHQIHDQVEGISVLEGLTHVDNKFVFELFQQLSLVSDGFTAFFG